MTRSFDWVHFGFGIAIIVLFFMPWIEFSMEIWGFQLNAVSQSGFDYVLAAMLCPTDPDAAVCYRTREGDSPDYSGGWLLAIGPVLMTVGLIVFRTGMPVAFRLVAAFFNAWFPALLITQHAVQAETRLLDVLTPWVILLLILCFAFVFIPPRENHGAGAPTPPPAA